MDTRTLSRRRLLAFGLAPLPSLALAACGGGGGDVATDPYLTSALPTPVSQHSAVALDASRVAVVGGSRGGVVLSDRVSVLDANTGTWTEAARMATGRAESCVVPLGSMQLLVHGGARSLAGSRTAEWVDLGTGTTVQAAASPTRLYHTATRLRDGRVLVAGGRTAEGYAGGVSPTLELWDPTSRSWRYVARTMHQARHAHTATLLPDGSVLFVGGYTADGMAASAERFDPATETLTHYASPMLARAGHAAVAQPDGRVLIAGGEQGSLAQPATPSALWLACEPWAVAAVAGAPPGIDAAAASAVRGGELLLFGGLDAAGHAVAAAWAFGATPRRLPPLPEPRAWHSATALPGGQVLVIGGEAGGRLLASAVRYG